jgi:hypothetical protein
MRSTIDLWMTRLSYFYIVLPFFLFTALWLNVYAALAFSGITLVSFVLAIRLINPLEFIRLKRNTFLWVLLTVLVIVFFSGIGSYTYQNEDHPYRNALFNDLVKYDWPVMYQVEGFEGHFLNGKTTIMTYYLGYYLPAALVGKFFGQAGANFFLYFWTVLGTLIVLYQLGKLLGNYSYKVFLMFLGWGTLFFVGALIKYPLEKFGQEGHYLWAGMRLYANSNLGSIYWIFNQSLAGWTILLLIMNKINSKNLVFVYSFCLFLSPFFFVGMFPFVLYFVFQNYTSQRSFKDLILSYLSFQNIVGAAAVVLLTYFYLQSNEAGQKFNSIPWPSLKIFIAFMFLSWGLIAAILFPKFYKEPLYWISILILIPLPFFQQGNGMDFPGRISMPAYFILLILAIRLVLEEKRSYTRWAMIVYFIMAGSAHFIFETGISMYKTAYANLAYRTDLDQTLLESENPKLKEIGQDLKSIKNKDVLTRDDFGTVLSPKNPVIWNYMADTEGSLFYKYLAKKREQ